MAPVPKITCRGVLMAGQLPPLGAGTAAAVGRRIGARSTATPKASTQSAPQGAAEQPAQVPDGEVGDGGGQDVALAGQVQHAGDQPRPTDPAGQHPGAQDQHADGDRPADGQQLAQVLAQQGPAELVLGHPGGRDRRLGGGVAGDIAVGQGRDHEHPAQEPDQRQQHRGRAHEGGGPQHRVVAPAQRGREQQDRDQQDRVGPGHREPGPDQAGPAGHERRQHHVGWFPQDVGPVEGRRQDGGGHGEGDGADHQQPAGHPPQPIAVTGCGHASFPSLVWCSPQPMWMSCWLPWP